MALGAVYLPGAGKGGAWGGSGRSPGLGGFLMLLKLNALQRLDRVGGTEQAEADRRGDQGILNGGHSRFTGESFQLMAPG